MKNALFICFMLAMFGLALGLSIGVAYCLSLAWNVVAGPFNGPMLGVWSAWALMWVVSILGKCFWGSQ